MDVTVCSVVGLPTELGVLFGVFVPNGSAREE